MNIAIFHELPFGGAHRVVCEYTKELRKRHRVDVYYVGEERDTKLEHVAHRASFFHFQPKEWNGHDWKTRLYKDTVELLRLRSLHHHIARDIDAHQYDVVFVHPSKYTQAPFVLSFLHTPSVYYCQEPLRLVYDAYVRSLNTSSGVKRWYESLNRNVRRILDATNVAKANLILANSRFSQQTIMDAYTRHSEVCYLGVDTDVFKTKRTAKSIDVLFVAGKAAIEGYDLLEQTIPLLKQSLRIHCIERKANGKGIPDASLIQFFNQSKMVVCLSRNEPFGLVPIEAGACGVPVIAVNEGGYKESIVHLKTGLLIERSPQKLAAAIEKFMASSSLRQQMGKTSRQQMMDHWTWQQSTKRVERWLASV